MVLFGNPFGNFSWRIHAEESQAGVNGQVIKCQPDLLPVPGMGPFHLTGYWIAEAFGISQYQVASSAVASGLSPGATIGAIFLGHIIISIACGLNGWVGAVYGINFPVYARASFGIRGTVVAVVCRAVAAIVWFGTQTYQGGQCVSVMLGAIWPSFKNMRNHLPPNAHVTSSELLCFFIFYVIQLPLLWIHISKLRYLFMVKVVVMPIFGFTLFGWAVSRAHGFGPVFSHGTSITSGNTAAYLFFSAMTSAIAPKATLALNICDFTRYAKSPRTVLWTNIFALSIPVTLCAILGVVVTSAVQVIYGVLTWNPLQVCELWSSRAAQFFAAFCWALAVIATNISANSIPKYINIRRGQYICAVLGVAACPWIVQNSAKSFTSFLGGYSIFLGPIAGILLTDFLNRVEVLLRHRDMHIPALYYYPSPLSATSDVYWYTAGFNWRALVAFTFALIPNLPGFALKVDATLPIPVGAKYIFSCVWPVGFFVAALMYLVFNIAAPPPIIANNKAEASQTSSMADEKGCDCLQVVRAEGV
ncbi:permease for cytosine/purines, uracil, thiamine, allantoin-domain-containing protein [Mucidula mucida]|nr:permease for cytosine/purines, uracil, thiamine, allantoin-domain-containing protein [Mucidula mucida]